MKLNTFRIKHFRNFSEETNIAITDLNVFIGKNDIGKSSILEALDIFFNGKPDKNDLSIDNDNSKIELTCSFSDLPEALVLDETVTTSLNEEFLLNQRGELEIKKVFSISASGSVSEEAYIICHYPDNPELINLLSKKRTTLRQQFHELGINSEGVNQNICKELRTAIRNHYYPDNAIARALTFIKINGHLDNEDNRKKIWISLKKFMPIFSLFFVDKPLNDQDSDIQSPMSEIIKEVLKREAITPLLDQLKNAIKEASSVLADQTITQLNQLDSNLTETLRSSFPKEPSWNTIFKLTLEDNRGIPLNKRGSGMRRLVLLSFFRAQVENRKTEDAPDIIYALEEPETSQHPNFQLMIVNALKELSDTDNAQVLFTTHNSNLAKEIPKVSLRYVYAQDAIVQVENGTNDDGSDNPEIINKIIETLGALPDPKNKVKVLIFVEGENDINAIKNYSKLLNSEDDTIINLVTSEEVAFIPTGGSQLKYYIEKKHLDGLLQSQVHIYDSDIADYVQSIENLNAEGNPSKAGFNTIKAEIENYLHPEAIKECYHDLHIDIDIPNLAVDDDVPEIVAKLVHESEGISDWESINPDPVKNVEKQKKKVSRAKRLLNSSAVDKMTIERLKTQNGYDEMRSWLLKIKELSDNY